MTAKTTDPSQERAESPHHFSAKPQSAGRNVGRVFGYYADLIAKASGSPITFLASCAIIAVWGITGPIFGYSDTWQLLINTGTTIVTFLMVFLIQNTQNRDTAAIQAKLDELIPHQRGAEHIHRHRASSAGGGGGVS